MLNKGVTEVQEDQVGLFQEFWRAHETCPLVGRNKIVGGMCPQVYGLFLVKLAALLTLIGGVTRTDSSGGHIRGEVHMLLVGDPGTGKSQVMKFAARVSPRSVVTTGRGSTGAGLTVTAVKEEGQWSLEAGALVLADGGLCCIDEFDGIREADRATMHEAMEQQTVHVAKAGMVTRLTTRTSVLGVTNSKGAYDRNAPVSSNVNLSGPLLSRFDIVMVLLDGRNPEWDLIVSDHILSNHQEGESPPLAPTAWTVPVLQQYVSWTKRNFSPVMTRDAEVALMKYYQQLRQDHDRSEARTTIRMLESLVRLAQAHARLLARNEVLLQDAVVAIVLSECSNHNSFLMGLDSAMYSKFSEDPEGEHRELEQRVVNMLGLNSLALEMSDAGV